MDKRIKGIFAKSFYIILSCVISSELRLTVEGSDSAVEAVHQQER